MGPSFLCIHRRSRASHDHHCGLDPQSRGDEWGHPSCASTVVLAHHMTVIADLIRNPEGTNGPSFLCINRHSRALTVIPAKAGTKVETQLENIDKMNL